MDNTYTIKKKFTALDLEEGNLVYDATHDAMLKVAYIGKRRVQSKTILQIIFEDTANGMLIRVEALDEKGTLPKDKKGNKQFKHLIKIRVNDPITLPYWGYPQRIYPVNPWYNQPTYPWYDFWYNTQTTDSIPLMSEDISGIGTINNPSNITIASDNVSSTTDTNTSTWTTSTSTGLSGNISFNTNMVNNDQTQQDQKTSQAFWNMFGFGYDEEKEEYVGKF